MRCMFVREGGTEDNPQRTLKEQNIFAVLKELGFTSELFAMQSEVWFYNSIEADNYSFREMIASEKATTASRWTTCCWWMKLRNRWNVTHAASI